MTALMVAAVGTAVVPTLGGCGGSERSSGRGPSDLQRLCAATDHGRTLVVQLADDWPPGQGGTVVARCSSPCGEVRQDSDELTRGVSGALTGARVELSMMGLPDSVVVTVLGPDGPLAEIEETLTWQRVGGTAECGGPMEAVVVIPAA
jgi:hypothetical protein